MSTEQVQATEPVLGKRKEAPKAEDTAADESATKTAKTSVEVSPDLLKKLRRQMEFYFSNSNYPKDKFMQEVASKNDGWFPLNILLRFNRLKALVQGHSDPVAALAQAAVASEDLLVLSECKAKVKRVHDVPSQLDLDSRTVIARPFGTEETLDAMLELFGQVGKVACVRFRKDKDRRKDSLFVEFNDVESATKASTTPLLFKGRPIIVQLKSVWLQSKNDPDFAEDYQTKALEADRMLRFNNLPADTTFLQIKEAINPVAPVRFVTFHRDQEQPTVGYARLLGFSEKGAKQVAEELTAAKTSINGVVAEYSALEGQEERDHWIELWKSKKQRQQAKAQGHRKGGRGGGRHRGRGRGRGRGGRGGNKKQRTEKSD